MACRRVRRSGWEPAALCTTVKTQLDFQLHSRARILLVTAGPMLPIGIVSWGRGCPKGGGRHGPGGRGNRKSPCAGQRLLSGLTPAGTSLRSSRCTAQRTERSSASFDSTRLPSSGHCSSGGRDCSLDLRIAHGIDAGKCRRDQSTQGSAPRTRDPTCTEHAGVIADFR
jgi:hypothetical protein